MAHSNLELAILKVLSKINERNISMVIDTSASMYKNFKYIKDVCILFLNHFAKRLNTSFNLVSFSKLCSSFADGLVSTSSKDSLILATAWIHALQCDSTTNTLSAIVTAFDDNADALVLFTDGLSSQKPTVFVRCIMEVAQGRPVHIVFVNFDYIDTEGIKILEMLATSTGGTFQVITNADLDSHYGILDQSLSSSYPLLRSPSKVKPTYDHVIERFSEISTDDKGNFLGRTVLARRSKDGSYYKGVVVKQPANEAYLNVLFQSEENGITYQDEESCHAADIITYDPTRANAICVGDFVLARFDLKGKYSPAQVKATRYVYDNSSPSFTQVFDVELPNKDRKQIPKSCAIPISSTHYVNITKNSSTTNNCCCYNTETHCCHSKQGPMYHSSIEHTPISHTVASPVLHRTQSFSPTRVHSSAAKDISHDLKAKIGEQVRESKLLMERLNNRNQRDDEQYIHPVRSFNLPSEYSNLPRQNSNVPRQSTTLSHEASNNHSKVYVTSDNYDSGFTDDDINYVEKSKRMPDTMSIKSEQTDSTRPMIYPSGPNLQIASDPIETSSELSVAGQSDYSSQQYDEKPYIPVTELQLDPSPATRHSRSASDEPRIIEKDPHPPVSWNRSSKRPRSRRPSARRYRSKSVGRNVVERSRKHWIGRPIWREVKPPRRETGTYSDCKRFEKPDTDEYHSADGVPFPMRPSDRQQQRCDNWLPGGKPCSNYLYHDIVAHRVVDHSCRQNHPTPPSPPKEEKHHSPRNRMYKSARKPVQKATQIQTERDIVTGEEREIFNERLGDGNAKIRITVRKDKPNCDVQTNTVSEEEKLREKLTRRDEIDDNPLNKKTQTENFQIKRDMLTKKRLEKEIDTHEVKLERLKELRKQTDARILRTKEMERVR